MIVGTAAVESPTYPKIAAAAAELLAGDREEPGARLCRQRPAGRSRAPAARARMAGAIMYAIAIRARLGTKASDLKAFANSMVPTICG